jgi:hypothetical protein
MVRFDRPCRCAAFPYEHEFGVSDCGDRLTRLAADPVPDDGDDYTEDHRLDSPARGQADGLNNLRRLQ